MISEWLILMPGLIMFTLPMHDVLCTSEGQKKHKYLLPCQNRHATFTPLCVSVDDSYMLGSEAVFLSRE